MAKTDHDTKDKYIFENDEKIKIIKDNNKNNIKEINIIFDKAEKTDVMNDVLKKLSDYFIEDILKLDNKQDNK